jgi:hypothetical protein
MPEMKKLRAVSILLVCLAATIPSRAATSSAGADYLQSAGMSFNQFTYSGNTVTNSRYGSIGISNDVGASLVNGTSSPMTNFLASGSGGDCVWNPYPTCISWYANLQVVSPTALTIDPIGNSATLVATINDTTNQPHVFNVRLTNPASLQIIRPDLVYNPQLNVYYDPVNNVFGATAASSPVAGIARQGYTITGTVDGIPLTPAPPGCTGYCNYLFAGSYQALSVGASAIVP